MLVGILLLREGRIIQVTHYVTDKGLMINFFYRSVLKVFSSIYV